MEAQRSRRKILTQRLGDAKKNKKVHPGVPRQELGNEFKNWPGCGQGLFTVCDLDLWIKNNG